MRQLREVARHSAVLARKASDAVRAEGLAGFAIRLARWLAQRRRDLVLAPARGGIPHLTGRYARWVAAGQLTAADLALQHEAARAFPRQPVISLLTPVFNPPEDVLRSTI
ncbi:MAG TPA: hypothetical protein VGR57_17315, partial [Ktedonobacterales bacterium]|nr:hypothetical protein [Ktedonobacterales bacterium]